MQITKEKLLKLLKDKKHIFITGHLDADLDALGSAIGLRSFLKQNKIKSTILVDDKNIEYATKQIYTEAISKFNILNSKLLNEKDKENAVLVIVDANKRKLIYKNILDFFDEYIVIDHHNTASDTISTNNLYIDTNVSSASEIITNLFIDNGEKIDSFTATALLSGIILDTNRFMIKTNKYTMRCVSYLYNNGADGEKVMRIFNETLNNYKSRQKVILNAKVKNGIAISKGLHKTKYRKEDLAKIADTLLSFQKVHASVVVGNLKEKAVGISIRSKGSFDASYLASEFGGGGSKNEAAAKIKKGKLGDISNKIIEYIENLED